MNKIIIAGHPQSGLEKVQELLHTCGMAQALPSRREGFTPTQISETLIKAHGAVPVQQVRNGDELQQITVAPVWQGLALDLVLANMNQPLWGWADTQAVYLLDFWKTQDPQTMFVLVYDAPQSALIRHAVEQLATDPEVLKGRVHAWTAYNAALLSFYLRNTERSLLVHADQVHASATQYVQQLSTLMDAALQLPGTAEHQNDTLTTRQTEGEAALALSDKAQPNLNANALAEWLAQQLLEDHPEVAELYAQLQAAASLPLRQQKMGQVLLAGHDMQQQRYQAWLTFVAQQTTVQQSVARLKQLDKSLQQAEQSAQQREQEQTKKLLKVEADLKDAKEQINLRQQVTVTQASTELQEENALLLNQLHKVQEELERYYLENRRLKASNANLQNRSKQAYYGAADRVKQQLSYRLGATMIAQSRSVGGWLCMPFVLNAEFKRFKQDQVARANQKLPPIAQYRDAHEAERVKQHLSYRLGARMIANAKTLGGWVAMPWALLEETQAFRKERR